MAGEERVVVSDASRWETKIVTGAIKEADGTLSPIVKEVVILVDESKTLVESVVAQTIATQ